MPRKYRSPLLLAGDVLTLLAFVYIGQRDHETLDAAQPFLGLLLPTAVFALPWVITSVALHGYPAEGIRFLPFIGKSLNIWLVAAPLGVLLRSVVLGRAVIPTVFIMAALGFGGLMMLGWRAVFAGVVTYLAHRRVLSVEGAVSTGK